MSEGTEDHGKKIPDELLVIVFGGIMSVVIVAGVGLAFLARYWNEAAEPDLRDVEPPAVVEVEHH